MLSLKQRLDQLVVDRFVNVRTSPEHPELRLYKYAKKVFFKQLWNKHPDLMEARGTVFHEDGRLISYPFTKVFNDGENDAGFPDEQQVTAVEKINGFLGVVALYENELLITTTGTFDSDYVALAKQYLQTAEVLNLCRLYPTLTFCFEICSPSNPHIVPQKEGAYLIGARENELDSPRIEERSLDMMYQRYLEQHAGFYRPRWCIAEYGEVKRWCRFDVKHEGFMCYVGQQAVKVKSRVYLTKKFLARSKKDFSLIWSDPQEALKTFAEEFSDALQRLPTIISCSDWHAATEQARLEILNRLF